MPTTGSSIPILACRALRMPIRSTSRTSFRCFARLRKAREATRPGNEAKSVCFRLLIRPGRPVYKTTCNRRCPQFHRTGMQALQISQAPEVFRLIVAPPKSRRQRVCLRQTPCRSGGTRFIRGATINSRRCWASQHRHPARKPLLDPLHWRHYARSFCEAADRSNSPTESATLAAIRI